MISWFLLLGPFVTTNKAFKNLWIVLIIHKYLSLQQLQDPNAPFSVAGQNESVIVYGTAQQMIKLACKDLQR